MQLKLGKNERLIFLGAAVFRILLFILALNAQHWNLAAVATSADGYLQIAKNMVAGHGFSFETSAPFTANVLRPPLYPYLIALGLFLFKTEWVFLAVQILISSLIPVLGYRLSKKIVNSEKISSLTGIFLVFGPYSAYLSYVFMTETVFLFLFLLSLFFLLEYFESYKLRNLTVSALFLGLATLTRPVAQYLPLIIGLFILWHFRRNIKIAVGHILLLASVFIVVLSPWFVRNYVIYGKLGLTTQTTYNFYTYFVPSVISLAQNTPYTAEKAKLLALTHFKDTDITLANSGGYLHAGWKLIKNHPFAVVKSIIVTEATFFSHDDGISILLSNLGAPSGYKFPGTPVKTLLESPVRFFVYLKQIISSGGWPLFIVSAVRIFWVSIAVLFILGIIRLLKNNGMKFTRQQFFSLILVIYFAGVSAINGFGINARFRMPVQIFIFIFATYFLFGDKERFLKNGKNA